MCSRILSVAALFLLFSVPCAVAAGADDDAANDEPPIAGRPAEFNGAVGSFKAVTTRVDRKELPAQSPLELSVTITAGGPVQRAPERPSLKKWTQFAVDDLPGPEAAPAGPVWKFRYRLKPLSTDVKQIPALEFVYYKPGIRPASKGYQTLYTESIPLVVTPAVTVDASAVQGGTKPLEPPESVLRVATGDHVLGSAYRWSLPSTLWLLIAFLLPPIGCVIGYFAARWLHPESMQQRRRRQSRAARQAIEALQKAQRLEADARVKRAAGILGDYLRQRWDLRTLEPTAAEVRADLGRAGLGRSEADRAAQFFELCDRQRFAPRGPTDLMKSPDLAINLINTLEADPCTSS
jgi:hypothetical protein